eukprot:COSAG03_NODE_3524_length_1970_cov_1.623196_1_plen_28_part_10
MAIQASHRDQGPVLGHDSDDRTHSTGTT